jgi:hypothetical protein
MAHARHFMTPRLVLGEMEQYSNHLTKKNPIGVYRLPTGARLDPTCIEPLITQHTGNLERRDRIRQVLSVAQLIKVDTGLNPQQREARKVTLMDDSADTGMWISSELTYREGGIRNRVAVTLHSPDDYPDTQLVLAPRPLWASTELMEGEEVRRDNVAYPSMHATVALNGLLGAVIEDRYPSSLCRLVAVGSVYVTQ